MNRRKQAYREQGRRCLAAALATCALMSCDSEPDLYPCDIRTTSCQDDVFYTVARVRGALWDPWVDKPPVRVITAAEYREELLADQAASEAAEASYDYWEAAKELVGLLDPEREITSSVDARVANVAAYYDYGTRAVTVVDHGNAGDLSRGTTVLAHELVHAAQDRELGLATFGRASTYDGSYARLAVIEGEARLYENVVSLALRGIGVDEADWDTYHSGLLEGAREDVFEADSPDFELYGLCYPLGARF